MKRISSRLSARRPQHMSNRSAELRWVQKHRSEYTNKWVVLEGEHLVASGDSAREVYVSAKRRGIKVPFLIQIEPPETLPFGGW